mgnify:CR=1 FL=1
MKKSRADLIAEVLLIAVGLDSFAPCAVTWLRLLFGFLALAVFPGARAGRLDPPDRVRIAFLGLSLLGAGADGADAQAPADAKSAARRLAYSTRLNSITVSSDSGPAIAGDGAGGWSTTTGPGDGTSSGLSIASMRLGKSKWRDTSDGW